MVRGCFLSPQTRRAVPYPAGRIFFYSGLILEVNIEIELDSGEPGGRCHCQANITARRWWRRLKRQTHVKGDNPECSLPVQPSATTYLIKKAMSTEFFGGPPFET